MLLPARMRTRGTGRDFHIGIGSTNSGTAEPSDELARSTKNEGIKLGEERVCKERQPGHAVHIDSGVICKADVVGQILAAPKTLGHDDAVEQSPKLPAIKEGPIAAPRRKFVSRRKCAVARSTLCVSCPKQSRLPRSLTISLINGSRDDFVTHKQFSTGRP